MSLVKQLVLAICVFLLVAFSGSFLINLDSSRDQLQAQLSAHAQDAATALSLSLSAHVDDPAMMELMVSSLFDTSYFSNIRIEAVADGSTLASRQRIDPANAVPGWFERMAGIEARQGRALLMDGWQQFARVEVTSHPHFALSSLWNSALGTLAWLALCGLVSAILGTLILRRQLRPLNAIAHQAEAIGRRHYQPLSDLPKTPELRDVGVAMNLMVDKLKRIFEEDAAKTEQLRRQAYHDELTDLPNRLAFEHALAAALSTEEGSDGSILALRIPQLSAINAHSGAALSDTLLKAFAVPLKAAQNARPEWLCCRTRGSEFLVLAPGANEQEMRSLANEVAVLAASLEGLAPEPLEAPLQIGITSFRASDDSPSVFSRVDQALMHSSFIDGKVETGFSRSPGAAVPARTSHDWQTLLQEACTHQRFELYFQPVVQGGASAQILHHKVLARLKEEDGRVLDAAQFLPWIERSGLSREFDRCIIKLALAQATDQPARLALTLTPATLASSDAQQELLNELDNSPSAASCLTFEADARYIQEGQTLAAFASDLQQHGSGFALQHVGRYLDRMGNLALIGLEYLKIDSSFIRALDQEPDKRIYLQTLVSTARRFDLLLIAEQVQSDGEIDALRALGVEWMQGHALAEPKPWARQ